MFTGRWSSRLAVAVLLLDAAALFGLGLVTHRRVLVGIALLLVVAALVVLRLARRQRARLDELQAARRAVGDEARVLAELVRRSKPTP